MSDLGTRIVAALGEPAARELLDVLTRSEVDRAALIGRLYARDDARWGAEILIDIDIDSATSSVFTMSRRQTQVSPWHRATALGVARGGCSVKRIHRA